MFYFHHGLKFCSQKCIDYVRGKAMIDGGAYIGDSASVLLHNYAPSRIISFDVSPINYNMYMHTMIKNRFRASQFSFNLIGLSDSLKVNSIDVRQDHTDCQTSASNGTFQVLMTDLDGFLE